VILRSGSTKLYVPPHQEAAVRAADEQAVDAAVAGDPALRSRLQALHEAVLTGSEDVSHELSLSSDAALPPPDLTLHEAQSLLAAIAPARSFLIPIGEATLAMHAVLAARPSGDLSGDLAGLARSAAPASTTELSEEALIQMFKDVFDPENATRRPDDTSP
jgi:hypothetical protein